MIKYKVEVDSYGTKRWYLNGKRHRENGPACVWADGSEEWFLNGKLHRENGPAIKWSDGIEEWYLNGKLHRENGPACKWAYGIESWWLNDTKYTKADYDKEIARRTAPATPPSCAGKVVEIDGKKYKLQEIA